jgi:uncharacterized coiled-coil protein SlyX
MAKLQNNQVDHLALGDLGVIRSILIGEEIHRIEERIAMQTAELERLHQHIANQESAFRQTINQLETTLTHRIEALEKRSVELTKEASVDLKTQIVTERKELSQLLRDLSEQLGK